VRIQPCKTKDSLRDKKHSKALRVVGIVGKEGFESEITIIMKVLSFSYLVRQGLVTVVCTILLATSQGVSGQSSSSSSSSRVIQVGDTFPKDVSLHQGFPPTLIPVSDYIAKYQKVIVVGLPGAFTPT
jgi:hypothetical protein